MLLILFVISLLFLLKTYSGVEKIEFVSPTGCSIQDMPFYDYDPMLMVAILARFAN